MSINEEMKNNLLLRISALYSIRPYDERKLYNDKTNAFTLDTCAVDDRDWLYETAVKHINFNGNRWIVLEGADTAQEAEAVHRKWLEYLKGDVESLTDCFFEITYMREART